MNRPNKKTLCNTIARQSEIHHSKTLNYIVSSTVDNIVILDDESVTHFLNAHQTKEPSEDSLKKIIHEKELEREAVLVHLEDELFLLKTWMI